MPETAEQIYDRCHDRLVMPDVADWDTFPFAGVLDVRPLQAPLEAEPPRRGAGGVDCRGCTRPDSDYLWTDADGASRRRGADRHAGGPLRRATRALRRAGRPARRPGGEHGPDARAGRARRARHRRDRPRPRLPLGRRVGAPPLVADRPPGPSAAGASAASASCGTRCCRRRRRTSGATTCSGSWRPCGGLGDLRDRDRRGGRPRRAGGGLDVTPIWSPARTSAIDIGVTSAISPTARGAVPGRITHTS